MNTLRAMLVLCTLLGFLIVGQKVVTPEESRAELASVTHRDRLIDDSLQHFATFSATTSTPGFDTLVYPQSLQVNVSANAMVLESIDETNEVTQWYKEKIKTMGLNSTSFVVTQISGRMIHKLSGADDTRSIVIEISKENDKEMVKIVIAATKTP